MSFAQLNRFFQYATCRRLSSNLSTFQSRVSGVIYRLGSVRIILCSGSNVSFFCRAIRRVRRCPGIFGVRSNNQFVRGVSDLSNVPFDRFDDRFRALTLSSQRDDEELSRLSMSWSRLLRRLSFIRCLQRIFGRFRHPISNRVRCVNGKFAFVTRFRHFAIVALSIASLAQRRRVKGRIRFGNLMAISSAYFATAT